jgi:hypothetical protein
LSVKDQDISEALKTDQSMPEMDTQVQGANLDGINKADNLMSGLVSEDQL